jgi:hypothetical protein
VKRSTTGARTDVGSKTWAADPTGATSGATARDARRGPATAATSELTATVDEACTEQQSESLGPEGAGWQVERVAAAGQATVAHQAAAEIDTAITVSATKAPARERLMAFILSIRCRPRHVRHSAGCRSRGRSTSLNAFASFHAGLGVSQPARGT